MVKGQKLTRDLEKRIKKELKIRASPRHVPAKTIVVPEICYTFSGKKVESAITNIIHGRKVTNRGAIRNPEILDFYTDMANYLNQN